MWTLLDINLKLLIEIYDAQIGAGYDSKSH